MCIHINIHMYEYICLDVHINICNAMDLRASTAAVRTFGALISLYSQICVYNIHIYI